MNYIDQIEKIPGFIEFVKNNIWLCVILIMISMIIILIIQLLYIFVIIPANLPKLIDKSLTDSLKNSVSQTVIITMEQCLCGVKLDIDNVKKEVIEIKEKQNKFDLSARKYMDDLKKHVITAKEAAERTGV